MIPHFSAHLRPEVPRGFFVLHHSHPFGSGTSPVIAVLSVSPPPRLQPRLHVTIILRALKAFSYNATAPSLVILHLSSIGTNCATMHLVNCVSAAVLLVQTATASTLTPPVLPLIVRNPYLSTWLADARDAPWKLWPMFWTGESVSVPL
jgi:hypothetical protein